MNLHYTPTRLRFQQTNNMMARLTVREVNPDKGYCNFIINVPSDMIEKIGSPSRVRVSGTIHEGLTIKSDKSGIIPRKASSNYHILTCGLGNVCLSRDPRRMVEVRCQVKGGTILISGPPIEWVRADSMWHPDYQPPTNFRLPAKEGATRPIRQETLLPAVPVEPEKREPTADDVFRPKEDGPSPTAPVIKEQFPEAREIPQDRPELAALLAVFGEKLTQLKELKEGIERVGSFRTILKRDLSGLEIDFRTMMERKTGGRQ